MTNICQNQKYEFQEENLNKFIRKIIVQERDPWVFEESVFGTYSPDSPEKFEKMFEYDWSLMHPPKLTNEEEEKEVKKMVK